MIDYTATYTPQAHGTKPAYTINGKLYRVASVYALARKMLDDGHEWSDTLQSPGIARVTLGYLALWTITEDDKRGIQRRRYRPFAWIGDSSEDGSTENEQLDDAVYGDLPNTLIPALEAA